MENKSDTLIICIISFILLNIADLITTIRATKHGAREANPVVRYLLKHRLFTLTKLTVTIIITFVLFSLPENCALIIAFICCSLYLFALINNVHVLRILKTKKGEMYSDEKQNL